MNPQAGPSHHRENSSQISALSNTSMIQRFDPQKFYSWELPQHQHSKQQDVSRYPLLSPLNYTDTPTKEELIEEIAKRKIQLEILENNAMDAERRYTDYASVKETEPQSQLRKFVHSAEKKYAYFDKQVRDLQVLAKDQEQQIFEITAQMELTIAELVKAKEDEKKVVSRMAPDTEMVMKIKDMEELCDTQAKQKQDLQRNIDAVHASLRNLTNGPPIHTANEIIANLDSKLRFNTRVTGLTISKYEIIDGVGKALCEQVGQRGKIRYELDFFMENGLQQVLYNPLDIGLLDQQLVTTMNESLQFDLKDTFIFFWRMMTYLNKPANEGN